MSLKKSVCSIALLFALGISWGSLLALADDVPATPAGSDAPPLTLGGRIFTDFYTPIRNPLNNPFQQISASAWLEGRARINDESSARFTLTGDRFEASNSAASVGEFRFQLREGFLSYAKSGWEFRAGQQIIPWGKSDVVNPTDFLSAKDYTLFNPDEEVRRQGAPTLLIGWTPNQGNSGWNFQGVWIPVFAASKLLIPASAYPAGISGATDPRRPTTNLRNSEFAAKIAYSANNWDWSLSAFTGWNHFPEFALTDFNSTAFPPTASIQPVFHQIAAVGSDASITSGKWIFRGEAAYIWTENNDGTNPLIQPTRFDSVAGVERPLGDDFRLQVQALWRYYPRFSDADLIITADPIRTQILQQIARANALLLNYQDRSRLGGTFRFSYSNESNGIESELFLIGNFLGGDYLLRPKFTYAWTDALKTTIGVDYYAGPDSRPLGALKHYSALFLEGKYSF